MWMWLFSEGGTRAALVACTDSSRDVECQLSRFGKDRQSDHHRFPNDHIAKTKFTRFNAGLAMPSKDQKSERKIRYSQSHLPHKRSQIPQRAVWTDTGSTVHMRPQSMAAPAQTASRHENMRRGA